MPKNKGRKQYTPKNKNKFPRNLYHNNYYCYGISTENYDSYQNHEYPDYHSYYNDIQHPNDYYVNSNQSPSSSKYDYLDVNFHPSQEKRPITKESLYEDSSTHFNRNKRNNDGNWTSSFWQKHNDSETSDSPSTSLSSETWGVRGVSLGNQNRLERTLNTMLAKPVEMSKGKSLLEKMGWQGGGLGKSGEGIVEPIAPKATYAVTTMGLGHLTEKPVIDRKQKHKATSKKMSRKPEFKGNFCTNVLQLISDFVQDDSEIELRFESRLWKEERKRIHLIVEKLRVCEDLSEFDNFTDKDLDVVKDIWVHNFYDLWTQSEGTGPDRSLCIFKEAPEHIYLITPDDLKEDTDDITEQQTDVVKTGKKKNKLIAVHRSDKKGSKNIINNQQNKTDDVIDITDDAKEKTGDDKDKVARNDGKQANENIENNQKIETDAVIDITDDAKEKTSDDKDKVARNDDKQVNENIITNQKIEIDDVIDITDDAKEETGSDKDKVTDVIKDKNIINNEQNDGENEVADEEINNETIKKKRHYKRNPELHKSKTRMAMELNFHSEIKLDKEENERTKVICIEDETVPQSVFGKIVKYFNEFAEDDAYTEFRFLGSFNEEEIENIKLFIDICMGLDESESDEKKELLATLENELYMFDVQEDSNGSTYIIKSERSFQVQPQ